MDARKNANNLTYSSESAEFVNSFLDEKFGLLRLFQCIIKHLKEKYFA